MEVPMNAQLQPLTDQQIDSLDPDRLASYREMETAAHDCEAAESAVVLLESEVAEAQKTLRLAIEAKRETERNAPRVTHQDLIERDLKGPRP
jgi:hypothetical protein